MYASFEVPLQAVMQSAFAIEVEHALVAYRGGQAVPAYRNCEEREQKESVSRAVEEERVMLADASEDMGSQSVAFHKSCAAQNLATKVCPAVSLTYGR